MAQSFYSITLSAGLAVLSVAFLGCTGNGSRPRDYFSDAAVRALAEAAERGDIKEIDRLVDSGIDVNAAGEHGMTPLVWAMISRNHDGFQRLLERGADSNRQHPEVDFGGGSSAMNMAAWNRADSFFLKSVLEHGGNPNLIEWTGSPEHPNERTTPIHRAVDSMRIENLILLIRAGADINFKAGHFGATPLIDAAAINWYEGVYRMLEAGADFNLKEDSGTTLTDFAVNENVRCTPEGRKWQDKVLDFLEKKGVDLGEARRRAEAHGIRTKKWGDNE